jgi:divalent metal cation (Fe/Co/Zn/Cd) transporter
MSLIPPILFLIGDRVRRRPPSERYPYGFARAVSAGYLGAAVALLGVGGFMLFDAGSKLAAAERPSLGGIPILGHVVWLGWLAFPVLLWCAIPAYVLGRAKIRAGQALNDKVLLADAQMSAANWQSAGAAMIGILGVAWGFWWLDALAAAFISVEIIRSGVSEFGSALGDLMDRRPEILGENGLDPLPETLTAFFKRQPWVSDAVVRVREEGRQFTGEVFVTVREESELVSRIAEASREACGLDPRLTEMLVAPVARMPEILDPVRADSGSPEDARP